MFKFKCLTPRKGKQILFHLNLKINSFHLRIFISVFPWRIDVWILGNFVKYDLPFVQHHNVLFIIQLKLMLINSRGKNNALKNNTSIIWESTICLHPSSWSKASFKLPGRERTECPNPADINFWESALLQSLSRLTGASLVQKQSLSSFYTLVPKLARTRICWLEIVNLPLTMLKMCL